MKNKLEELTNHERQIAVELGPLFTLFPGQTENEKLISRYAEELGECFPNEWQIEHIPRLIKKCIRTCKKFPTIAEILEVAEWRDRNGRR